MVVSSLEQHLAEQQKLGNLTNKTIAAALQEARKSEQYLYNIRDTGLKTDIFIRYL